MVAAIMNWIKQSLLFGLDIFDKFISSDSDILKIFMSFFVIFAVYRFLISPLLGGGAGSDKAKSKKEDSPGGSE